MLPDLQGTNEGLGCPEYGWVMWTWVQARRSLFTVDLGSDCKVVTVHVLPPLFRIIQCLYACTGNKVDPTAQIYSLLKSAVPEMLHQLSHVKAIVSMAYMWSDSDGSASPGKICLCPYGL